MAKLDPRPVTLLAFCLLAAGCNQTSPQAGAKLEDSIQPQQSKMMALAPAARQPSEERSPLAAVPNILGVVSSVRTRTYADGVRQDIALKGGAIRTVANGLTILARTIRQPTLDESVPLSKPTESAIRSEIGAQFPHIPMQVVDRQSSNSYGPYGLALGRAPGDVHCLYMWQWIDANRLPQGSDFNGPASLRVRICRADATFDAMAAAMDQLVLGHEAAMSMPEHVASNEQQRVIVADPAIVAPEPPPETAAPKTPAHKHRVAKRKRAKTKVASIHRDDVAGDEPQYLSPTATASAIPRPQPMAPAVPSMAADLPPQAYLGPKADAQKPVSWRN